MTRDDNDRLQAGEPLDPREGLVAVGAGHQSERTLPLIGDVATGGALERLERRADGREAPIPVPWQGLERALGGGLWSGLYVLVGGTGSGKSQLALQLALTAAQSRHRVLYVALELGAIDIQARLLGLLAGVRWSRLLLGDAEALQAARPASSAVSELPLHLRLAEPFRWSGRDLVADVHALRELEQTHGRTSEPVLVVVDFLQLAGDTSAVQEARLRISDAAYSARQVARDPAVNAAILLISSTARNNYRALNSGISGEPGDLVGLGKESGDVEYAADAVLVLRQATKDREGPTDRRDLVVAKLRWGKPQTVALSFDGNEFVDARSSRPPATKQPALTESEFEGLL